MKKFMKTVPLLLIMVLLLVGCDAPEPEKRDVKEESVLEPTYNENMEEIHEIVRSQDLGDFTLVTKYDTMDYDLNKWKIIDNKTIRMSVWTEGLSQDWDVIIEHVHIDMFIASNETKYPTLLQDSMDDKYHGIKQDGFVVSDDTVYENIFGIIGANEVVNRAVQGSEYRLASLRESDFSYYKYNMNVMQVIYDIMVKKPGNDFYETIAVYDEIVIPVGYK